MPPLTSTLLSRSTTGSSTRVSAAATAAISRPAAATSSPAPSRPSPSALPKPASPFASDLAGRLFGGHRAAARSALSATATFESRFASAATKNSYDEILTGLGKPGGRSEFGKYYSLPALSDPRIRTCAIPGAFGCGNK